MDAKSSMSFNTGVAVVSVDHTLVWVNKAFADIVGYPTEKLAGQTFDSITHPDDLKLDSHLADRLFKGEIDTYEMDKRYIHLNGSVVPIHLKVILIRDRAEVILYAVSTVEKIAEREVYRVAASKPLTKEEMELDRIRRAVIGF